MNIYLSPPTDRDRISDPEGLISSPVLPPGNRWVSYRPNPQAPSTGTRKRGLPNGLPSRVEAIMALSRSR